MGTKMTRQQRKRRYEQVYIALQEKLDSGHAGWPHFLCHKIPAHDAFLSDYPEVILFEPLKYKYVWWDSANTKRDNLERLTALAFMIAMCDYKEDYK